MTKAKIAGGCAQCGLGIAKGDAVRIASDGLYEHPQCPELPRVLPDTRHCSHCGEAFRTIRERWVCDECMCDRHQRENA